MALTNTQWIDYLSKRTFYNLSSTDNGGKTAPEELIPSPNIVFADGVWLDSDSIPSPAAGVSGIVDDLTGANRIEMVADPTVPGNQTWVAVLNTTLTYSSSRAPGTLFDPANVVDYWVPFSFDATYLVKVYTSDPNPTPGTPIDLGGNDAIFDYNSGVLQFVNGPPSAVASASVLYIEGYRYIGSTSASGGSGLNDAFVNLSDGTTTLNATGSETLFVEGLDGVGLEAVDVGGDITIRGTLDYPNMTSLGLDVQDPQNDLFAIYDSTGTAHNSIEVSRILYKNVDADGDTYIQVSASHNSDEDTITAKVGDTGNTNYDTSIDVMSLGSDITFQALSAVAASGANGGSITLTPGNGDGVGVDGAVIIDQTPTGGPSDLQFVSGSNYVGFAAPVALSANQIWTLPDSDGSANEVLTTDGSGVLSFQPVSSFFQAIDNTFTIQDDIDATKFIRFEVSPVSTSTTRVINSVDRDITLDTITVSQTDTNATDGSLYFAETGKVLEDNTNLRWDNTAKQLIVNTPTVTDNALDVGGSVNISGDLTVSGTTTTIDTANLLVEDPLMLLARNQAGAPSLDIGVLGERGTSNNVANFWDESADEFAVVETDTGGTTNTVNILEYSDFSAGNINVRPFLGSTGTKDLRFWDETNSNYVGFSSPANVTTNQIWNLPAADGGTDDVMITDGAGNLSFASLTSLGANAFQQVTLGGNQTGDTALVADSANSFNLNFNAGEGLTVAGTAASDTMDLALDINGLTTVTALDGTDEIALYDTSAGSHFKTTVNDIVITGGGIQNLYETVSGDTGTFSASSATDTLSVVGTNGITTAVTQIGSTTTITIDAGTASQQNLFETFTDGTTPITASSATDTITVDAGAGLEVVTSTGPNTITTNLDFTSLTPIVGAVDPANDLIALYDTSAATHVSVTPQDIVDVGGGIQNLYETFTDGTSSTTANTATDTFTFTVQEGISGVITTDTLTVEMDVDSLPTGTVDMASDFLPLYDTSLGQHIKITPSQIVTGGGGVQDLYETIDADSGGPITASSSTDTLTITGGTGVTTSVSQAGSVTTLTVDASAAVQNLFETVTDGVDPIVAGTTTDTLNVSGTDGVNLSTNSTTSTLESSLAFNTLSAPVGGVDSANDLFALYDISGSVHAVVTANDIVTSGGGVQNLYESFTDGTNTSTADNATDTMTITGQEGISAVISTDTLTLELDFPSLTSQTPISTDEVAFVDGSGSHFRTTVDDLINQNINYVDDFALVALTDGTVAGDTNIDITTSAADLTLNASTAIRLNGNNTSNSIDIAVDIPSVTTTATTVNNGDLILLWDGTQHVKTTVADLGTAVIEEFHYKTPARAVIESSIDLTGGTFVNDGSASDGVTLVDGDRVIINGQGGGPLTPDVDNGLYEYVLSTNTFIRTSDADNAPTGSSEFGGGVFVVVREGTKYADTGWVVAVPDSYPATIGTDTFRWVQATGAGLVKVLEGNGIDITSNTQETEYTVTASVDGVTITNVGGTGDQLAVRGGAGGNEVLLSQGGASDAIWVDVNDHVLKYDRLEDPRGNSADAAEGGETIFFAEGDGMRIDVTSGPDTVTFSYDHTRLWNATTEPHATFVDTDITNFTDPDKLNASNGGTVSWHEWAVQMGTSYDGTVANRELLFVTESAIDNAEEYAILTHGRGAGAFGDEVRLEATNLDHTENFVSNRDADQVNFRISPRGPGASVFLHESDSPGFVTADDSHDLTIIGGKTDKTNVAGNLYLLGGDGTYYTNGGDVILRGGESRNNDYGLVRVRSIYDHEEDIVIFDSVANANTTLTMNHDIDKFVQTLSGDADTDIDYEINIPVNPTGTNNIGDGPTTGLVRMTNDVEYDTAFEPHDLTTQLDAQMIKRSFEPMHAALDISRVMYGFVDQTASAGSFIISNDFQGIITHVRIKLVGATDWGNGTDITVETQDTAVTDVVVMDSTLIDEILLNVEQNNQVTVDVNTANKDLTVTWSAGGTGRLEFLISYIGTEQDVQSN